MQRRQQPIETHAPLARLVAPEVLPERRSQRLRELGEDFRTAGWVAAAEPLLRDALTLAEREHACDPLVLAATLNALGLLCKDLARYEEAYTLYRRALQLVRGEEGARTYPDQVASLYHNLGGIEHARGHYLEAEVLARTGLAIRESMEAADPSALAADMSALAAILDGQRRFGEAESLYEKALAIFERAPERHAGEIAVASNGLGALHARLGALERAAGLLARALDLKTREFGPRHPDVAVTLNNLAVVRRRQGDLPRADDLYEDALEIFATSLGPDHPRTVACRNNRQRIPLALEEELES